MSFSDELYEPPQADWSERLSFRNWKWQTKKGECISLKDMDDSHLLNSAKLCRDSEILDCLLKEMTYRLFEERVKKLREEMKAKESNNSQISFVDSGDECESPFTMLSEAEKNEILLAEFQKISLLFSK